MMTLHGGACARARSLGTCISHIPSPITNFHRLQENEFFLFITCITELIAANPALYHTEPRYPSSKGYRP